MRTSDPIRSPRRIRPGTKESYNALRKKSIPCRPIPKGEAGYGPAHSSEGHSSAGDDKISVSILEISACIVGDRRNRRKAGGGLTRDSSDNTGYFIYAWYCVSRRQRYGYSTQDSAEVPSPVAHDSRTMS